MLRYLVILIVRFPTSCFAEETGSFTNSSRVISWKAMAGEMKDPLLYIESMPFAETRNYVMQVSAQYWIYQMMMDETPTTLKTLAKGQWPNISQARS